MKLVTIGIPFFNNQKTLPYAIRSTINQTYQNLEIILMDDGSTDHSLRIAREFAEKDPRIKVISDNKNKGLIARLNQIIDLANGEYIARMDADDMMSPIRIERQITFLSSHQEVDVVTTGMASLDNKLNPIGKRCCQVTTPSVLNVFRNGEGLIHASMMTKTSWAKNNKYSTGYDRAEDRELFTRTMKETNYRIIPEPLYYYLDVQNMTLEKYLKSYQSERKAIRSNWKNKISLSQFIKLLIRSALKSLIIRLYFQFNIEDRLFRNKNDALTKSENLKITEDIKVFTTKV